MEFKTDFRNYKKYADLKEFFIKLSNLIKQLQRHFSIKQHIFEKYENTFMLFYFMNATCL